MNTENVAVLKYNEENRKWEVWFAEKVISRSFTKEYVVSSVLDSIRSKIKVLNITKLVDEANNEISYLTIIKQSSFIKNTDTYADLISGAVENRKQINETLALRMKNLRDAFSNLFGVNKNKFTLLKDMLYYQGGWPTDDSEAKLHDAFMNFSFILKFYTYLGKEDEIKKYCKKFGMTVEIDKRKIENLQKVKLDRLCSEDWYKCFGKTPMPRKTIDYVNKIFEEAMIVQKEICERADSIKIYAAKKAEIMCSVKEKNFINAVNVSYKSSKVGLKTNSAMFREKMNHIMTETALVQALEKQNKTIS